MLADLPGVLQDADGLPLTDLPYPNRWQPLYLDFLLFQNGIIGEKDEINAQTLPKVKMPNRDGFVKDNRPDTGKKKK